MRLGGCGCERRDVLQLQLDWIEGFLVKELVALSRALVESSTDYFLGGSITLAVGASMGRQPVACCTGTVASVGAEYTPMATAVSVFHCCVFCAGLRRLLLAHAAGEEDSYGPAVLPSSQSLLQAHGI